jgi:hypothetical protein
MSAYGTHRVRLTVDLSRYHEHLKPGAEGISVPGVKTTVWGYQDRFWAVRYDCCGHLMDTLLASLAVVDRETPEAAS